MFHHHSLTFVPPPPPPFPPAAGQWIGQEGVDSEVERVSSGMLLPNLINSAALFVWVFVWRSVACAVPFRCYTSLPTFVIPRANPRPPSVRFKSPLFTKRHMVARALELAMIVTRIIVLVLFRAVAMRIFFGLGMVSAVLRSNMACHDLWVCALWKWGWGGCHSPSGLWA